MRAITCMRNMHVALRQVDGEKRAEFVGVCPCYCLQHRIANRIVTRSAIANTRTRSAATTIACPILITIGR